MSLKKVVVRPYAKNPAIDRRLRERELWRLRVAAISAAKAAHPTNGKQR